MRHFFKIGYIRKKMTHTENIVLFEWNKTIFSLLSHFFWPSR